MTGSQPAAGGGIDGAPQTIGFLLLPGFSLMTFSSAVEPLRQANRLSGARLYDWRLISIDGRPATASAGSQVVADLSIHDRLRLDRLFVCSGIDAEAIRDKRLLARLRQLDRSGVPVGGLSTATFVLARAGLLQGRRCTIHWESLAAFREAFPEIEVRANLFEVDRGRITCAGATACLDLMLHLIEARCGPGLAGAISQQFNLAHVRFAGDDQTMPDPVRLRGAHPKLLTALDVMQARIEDPLDLDALADNAALSKRQLERLFHRHLGTSAMKHYKLLRLGRARLLLLQSALPVSEIALACGFRSLSHFARAYRSQFGRNPRDERQAAHRRGAR